MSGAEANGAHGREVHLYRSRFALAILVSCALVLSAPFAGQIRNEIRTQFPGHFVLIVGGLIGVGLVVALAAAVVRIRERRWSRYALILTALVVAAVYSALRAGPNPESNAVERFHFLQYGLITFLFYRSWRPLADLSILLLPTLAGLIVGSAEEWFQWFIPNRVGEMGDVFLNLVAIGTGLLFSLGADPPARMDYRLGPVSRPRVLRLAAAAIAVFGLFLHSVHLGYDIEDEEVGVFNSRYTREQLLALQDERAARWAVSPPPTTVVRLSREDQYLTEGIQHVRWRNRQWSEGNVTAAWLENRILEKYFLPVLDTPTHEGRDGHRWPAEQRADAERRAAAAPLEEPYVSGAYTYRILTWSKWVFWIAVSGIVAGLVTLAHRAGRAAGGATVRTAD